MAKVTWWAVAVCAVTIVVSIGGPLFGRGVFAGVNVVRYELPWLLDTPSDATYKLPPVFDTIEVGIPARELIRETLVDQLRLPLWDPYANGGTPLGSQPNTGILSPLNWPLLILGVKLGLAWAGLLRLAIAAGGMYLLLRRLGTSHFAGVSGGLVYCTSGFIVSWSNWPQAEIAALIPWLFFFGDRVRERRRALDVAGFAIVIASVLLEGYPPLTIVIGYLLAVFLVVRWWDAGNADAARPSISERMHGGARAALLIGAGAALGATLVAFQLLPFLQRLSVYDISYRAASGDRRLPAAALLTSVFPWAQGSPAHPGTSVSVDRVTNFSITEQFVFLGAAAVVLAVVALLFGRPRTIGAGAYGFAAVGTIVFLVVLFGKTIASALATDVLYALPGMGQVPFRRLIGPLLFLAALLAGIGVERCIAGDRASFRLSRRVLVRAAVLAAFALYLVIPALRSELDLTRTTITFVFFGAEQEVGQRSFILGAAVVPVLIALVTIGVVILAARTTGMARTLALVAIPVLLAIEGLMVTSVMFPRPSDADFYPTTGAIRYLQEHVGHERIAPAERMLYFGSNAMYGLRSIGGHSFTARTWQELFRPVATDSTTATQLRIPSADLEVAQSPVLDRLAARFFVDSPWGLAFGALELPPTVTGSVRVGEGETASSTVAPGPLRAVVANTLGRIDLDGTRVFLEATVRDTGGRIVATGRRRLGNRRGKFPIVIPVAPEVAPGGQPLTVEFALRSNGRDRIQLSAQPDGQVAVGTVRPNDDLELVYSDAGADVYRRPSALARIRWADRTVVERNATRRVRRITTGDVERSAVVLDRPGPAAEGRPARVEVLDDDVDHIRARVHAEGDGYLVVADALQTDWRAAVDGKAVPIRNADHALVAIWVPEGTHTVALDAAPRGWRTGILVSVAALVVLLVLVGWALLRRRRPADPPFESTASSQSPNVDSK